IRTRDVERSSPATATSKSDGSGKQDSAPEQEFTQQARREKMSRRRQTIAIRLVEAQHNAAMLTTFNEVDMTAVMNLRKERQESFVKKNDIKLGFMSFFTKASVAALKEFPIINAE